MGGVRPEASVRGGSLGGLRRRSGGTGGQLVGNGSEAAVSHMTGRYSTILDL